MQNRRCANIKENVKKKKRKVQLDKGLPHLLAQTIFSYTYLL